MTSSITNWNLNEPDFTSPLDGSLDSIRANYHYLLMVAAHGSVVLPGWNTTVTATDYSEPDTITLTRGTQRIIFNYTWTDGSVSAIQMCYDDGVSSPGLYCFPEIPFYYDDSGNPVGTSPPPPKLSTHNVTFAGDQTTETFSLSGVNDITQCIPFYSCSHKGSGSFRSPEHIEFEVKLWDDAGTPKATFTRNAVYSSGATPTNDVIISLALLEFPSSVSVYQYNYTSLSITGTTGIDGYYDNTITAINTNAAFVVMTCAGWDNISSHGMSGMMCGELTSSTNLRIHAAAPSQTVGPATAYVVSDPDGAVFTTSRTAASIDGTATTVNITVPSHTASTTMAVVSFYNGGAFGTYPNSSRPDILHWAVERTSDTNYQLTRYGGADPVYPGRAIVQLITFNGGVTVQHLFHTVAAGTRSDTDTISSVDTSKAFAASYFAASGANASLNYGLSGSYSTSASHKLTLSDSTTVALVRGPDDTTADEESKIGYQVIEIN